MCQFSARSLLPSQWARAKGLTVLELLLVVGMVLLLAGLLLPALERARASARRLLCRNNLHQIGLACTPTPRQCAAIRPAGCWRSP